MENEDYGFGQEMNNQGDQETQTQEDSFSDALDIMYDLDQLDKIDKQFDSVFKDVVSSDTDMQILSSNIRRLEINNLGTVLSSKSLQSQYESPEEKAVKDDLNELLNTNTDDIFRLFNDQNIHNNRKKLYDLYNEIADINPIAYRMLKVYVDNILVKNIQNKQFLNIVENDANNITLLNIDKNKKKAIQAFIKTLIVYFDLQNKLKNNILPNALKHGDHYLEIVDLSPIGSLIEKKRELITENITIDKVSKKLAIGYIEFPQVDENSLQENYYPSAEEASSYERMLGLIKDKKKIEEADINLLNDILGLQQEEEPEKEIQFDLESFSDLDFNCVKDIHLKMINPSNVIKIDQDGINYGYLIIEDLKDEDTDDEINLYARFMNDDGSKSNQNKNKDINQEITDKFTKEIISKLSEHLNSNGGNAQFITELPDELSLSLKVILYQKIKEKTKLKFRFIEPNKLINFHTNIDKFAPYGTSIFDPITLPVKLYTVALMSSVISRLSRASVLRKWNVEVGNRRNHSQIIKNLQKELKTKNITFDDLSSMRNISEILTDFRDVATVTKNGQKFIDLEIMPMHDRALPINDLQDLRNELIAATGVPSVYLNIGDQAELRETLVNLNIGFANNIAALQGFIEDGLSDLFNTIFQIILKHNGYSNYGFFNISQYFQLKLNPPLILQLQNNEAVISSVANMIGTLQQAGVQTDPIEFFKTYLPTMNWDKIKKDGEEAVKQDLKKQIMQQPAPNQDQQEQQGGF